MNKKLLLLITGLSMMTQLIFAQVPSYVSTNGLVGYWPFNGNANDESGNGLNGTVTGTTLTSDRNGNINSAYSFNGTSDFIQITNNTLLNLPQTFSISVWYKINNISSSNEYLISRPGDTNGNLKGYSIVYKPSGNQFLFSLFAYWTSTNFSNSFAFASNNDDTNWHHFVFTKPSGSPRKIYIDGVIQSGGNAGSLNGQFISSQPLFFGKGPTSGSLGSTYFNGLLDDIGIWSRELSSLEVTQLFNNQLSNNTFNYNNQFTISPNPLKDYLIIDKGNSVQKDLQLNIYNLLGQEVQHTLLNDSLIETITINNNLNKGIYLVQITNSLEILQNTKIIIE